MKHQLATVFVVTVSGAVLTLAGASIADVPSSEVPNAPYSISDEKDPDAEGSVQATGDSFFSGAAVECAPFTGGSAGSLVLIYSSHPDGAKLKKNKAEVEQAQKDNQAVVEFRTGTDPEYRTFLSCEKAEVQSDVKDKKTPFKGSFSASAKNCVCDSGDCDQYAAQIATLSTDCDDNKSIKGSFKDGEIKKIKIKGKGDAEFGEF